MVAMYDLDIIGRADLPGELAPVLDDVDYTPDIGGCGRALPLVAVMLVRGDEAAVPHLEACRPCRDIIIGIGRVAAGVDALLFFEGIGKDKDLGKGMDIATPQTGSLAATV